MPRSRPQQGAHQAHRRVHLVVAVQGFPQQLVQGRPARHWQVLGLPHALGKVAVDVGLGEHQVFIEFLGEARPGGGLSWGAQAWWGSAGGLRCVGGAQPWGSALPMPPPSPCRGAQAASAAPVGCGAPSFSSTTYIKALPAGVRQHLPKVFLIPFIEELVSVHPLGFVEPEAHQVHGTFQALGGGEQEALAKRRMLSPRGLPRRLPRAERKGWLWEGVVVHHKDVVHRKDTW